MNKLSHLTLGAKLGGGFAIVLLLTLLVAGLGVYELRTISASTEEIATSWLPSIKALGKMRAASNQIRRAENELAIEFDNEKGRSEAEAKIADGRTRLDQAEAEYAKLVVPGEEAKRYEQFKASKAAHAAAEVTLIALSLIVGALMFRKQSPRVAEDL